MLDAYSSVRSARPHRGQDSCQENALKPPTGAPSSWKSAMPEEHHSSTWTANEAIKRLQKFAKQAEAYEAAHA